MKKTTLPLHLVAFIFWFLFPAYGQQWGVRSSSSFTNEAFDLVTDAAGNSYVCGYVSGETTFGSNFSIPTVNGTADLFVAKYNPQGQPVWVKKFGGPQSDRALAIDLGPNNEVYITGQFFGNMVVGSTTLSGNGSSKDIFIIKLDNAGTPLWAISQGGASEDNAYDIKSDAQGNVYLSGQFKGSANIGGQTLSSQIDPNTNLPGNDLFIAKYSPSGAPLWVRAGQAPYDDRGLALDIDATGNIFFTGQFSQNMTFAGATINNAAYNVGFLAKFNSAGTLLYLNRIQAGFTRIYDVKVENTGNVLITGDFLGNLNYHAGGPPNTISNNHARKIFVLKVDNGGGFLWGKALGSNNAVSARRIAVNHSNQIFVTGHFECSFTELNVPNGFFNSVGHKDIFVWSLLANGNTSYTRQIGGQEDDEAHGLALINNEPVITGGYTRNLNFPSPSISTNVPVASSVNSSQLNFHFYGSNQPFYYLVGDQSRNFFLSNYVNGQLQTYSYYHNSSWQSVDSTVAGYVTHASSLFTEIDTLTLCEKALLRLQPHTYRLAGPAYHYSWNTGDSTDTVTVFTSGMYGLNYSSIDGCYSGSDSLFFQRNYRPDPAHITDDHGIANQQPPLYPVYEFCRDTVEISFSNLCSGCSISITDFGNVNHTDTLPHPYLTGVYQVKVDNGLCTRVDSLLVTIHDSLDYNIQIVPNIIMHDTLDYNDSITVCAEDIVRFEFHDTLLNPSGSYYFALPYPKYPGSHWLVTQPSGNTTQHGIDLNIEHVVLNYTPVETGWHQVHGRLILGGANTCNIDTVHFVYQDSFYIEVLPLPVHTTSLSVSNIICPGGSVFITATPPFPNHSWTGPVNGSIIYMSPWGDSALVQNEGNYSYYGTATDSLTGCSDDYVAMIFVDQKDPPNIDQSPTDGIICPYDSIEMQVPNQFVSYNWHGPAGANLSNTYNHFDDDIGFYYCVVEDSSGCFLTTPTIELNEFTSPYFDLNPGNIYCGDPIEITVMGDASLQVNWLPPLSGSSMTQTVNQPGWYYCEMQQCGMTFVDSVQIIDGTFQPLIMASDTVICQGEMVVFSFVDSTHVGLWNTGDYGAYTMAGDPGPYFAEVTNSFGCIANSDTIVLTVLPYPTVPQVSDTSICLGSSLTLSTAPTDVVWFNADSIPVITSNQIVISGLNEDTTIYYSLEAPNCAYQYQEVNISIDSNNLFANILGDTIACYSDTIWLLGQANGDSTFWMDENGQILGSADSIQVNSSMGISFRLVTKSNCYADTAVHVITWRASEKIDLGLDVIVVCPGEEYTITPNINDTLTWQYDTGIYNGTHFTASSDTTSGIIVANGTDAFGCAYDSDAVLIEVAGDQLVIEMIDSAQCQGDTAVLAINLTLSNVIWSNNGNTLAQDTGTIHYVVSGSNAVLIQVTGTNSYGCVLSDTILVSPAIPAVYSWSDDTTLCLNEPLIFNGSSNAAFAWHPDTTNNLVPPQAGVYYYQLTLGACVLMDSIQVNLRDCREELPNVITPNGDGKNDFLILPEVVLYPNNRLLIFNRWGEVVFDAAPYRNEFNGEGLNAGAYFYTFYKEKDDKEGSRSQYLHLMK